VRCEPAREAISADLDHELPTPGLDRVEAHLATCAACRSWREQAQRLTRRVRVGGPLPAPEQVGAVLAAVRVDQRRRRARRAWLVVAGLVAGAGLIQLLATVPMLLLARGPASGGGLVHQLGLVELGIGAGFFIGALVVLWRERNRPTLTVVRTSRFDGTAARGGADIHEVA
jgi:predicted anti-sigma-YlaC factor YlaD